LKCVVAGVDDQWIADRLQISIATVASHRKHIRQKLALHNDRDLIGYARRWGLLAQSETQNSPHATASGGG